MALVLVPQVWQAPNKVVVLKPAIKEGLPEVPVYAKIWSAVALRLLRSPETMVPTLAVTP